MAGLQHWHAADEDMLVQAGDASSRRAVHLIFAEDVPLRPVRNIQGIRVVPLADLVRMKLTSFRLRDQTHVKDLDEVGLITPEIEAELSPILHDRLAQVRAYE